MRYALFLLLLTTGCSLHVRPGMPIGPSPLGPLYVDAGDFVESLARKMPEWDSDAVAIYERTEIATVKADIEVSRMKRKGHYLDDVDKLHQDWDALLALDLILQRSYVI